MLSKHPEMCFFVFQGCEGEYSDSVNAALNWITELTWSEFLVLKKRDARRLEPLLRQRYLLDPSAAAGHGPGKLPRFDQHGVAVRGVDDVGSVLHDVADGVVQIVGATAQALECSALAWLSAGITQLDQVTRFTEAQLLALHGMGPNAIQAIKAALLAQGKSLAHGGQD